MCYAGQINPARIAHGANPNAPALAGQQYRDRCQPSNAGRQVCPARSAPGGRPKRRLNARLKELSDW
jgi:hypothetical protein